MTKLSGKLNINVEQEVKSVRYLSSVIFKFYEMQDTRFFAKIFVVK